MKNLFFAMVATVFMSATAFAHDGQQGPSYGEELWGSWDTDIVQTIPNATISLELTFNERSMEVTSICETRHGRVLTATAVAMVRYSQNSIKVLRGARARVDEGPFYCEASVTPQTIHFSEVTNEDGVYKLYFEGNRRPATIFRK